MTGISREEASNIALAAAKEATREVMTETFALLGINISNFEDIKKLRDDLELLHSLRSGASKIGAKFVLTIVSIIAGAVAIGAWEYLKPMIFHAIGRPFP